MRGETNAAATGKMIILPSSFTGGARYMLQNYQDAMAICRWAGYPDLFVTFTCNPAWPEITRFSQLMKVKPSCRPELLSRVFKVKLQRLLRTIKEDSLFGSVKAVVYTIEFQKRGLPHAHILLFLENDDKITTTQKIDEFISTHIPDKVTNPRLYGLVKRYMTHGPCGVNNPKSPCMREKRCSKHFPKSFSGQTTMDEEGFPTYKLVDDGRVIDAKGTLLDNRYIVPYNATLLYRFEAHINVEKCNQSTAIKYLFKYISKGNDRVVAGIFNNNANSDPSAIVDEIQHYYNFRYISACEAAWRIFGFDIHYRMPAVERLSFHLPNQQFVVYSNNTNVSALLDQPRVCESQFLSWIKKNVSNTFARTLTYQEFPSHFVFLKSKRKWKSRKKCKTIGRISHVSPSSGELYYLRMLLTQVRGPQSYDEIKTVGCNVLTTFREACFARGLLDDDAEFIRAIKEASSWTTGQTLQNLFASMLLCCCLQRPDHVWEMCSAYLSEDLHYINRNDIQTSGATVTSHEKADAALRIIDSILQKNGKSLSDYPSLPCPSTNITHDYTNSLLLQELSYDRAALHASSNEAVQCLNFEQGRIYKNVMSTVENRKGGFFFVNGYGGTGKTFLWNALASTLRAIGLVVLTVASSGIAATLFPSGRTAHSRFAIPIDITEFSTCSIGQTSKLADLLRTTSLIIWDEAPMIQRYCIEAFDRSLKDIMHCKEPFGGKCVIMGGNFRQILPVIPKGTRVTVVNACINASSLWDYCTVFHLTQNMRLTASTDVNEQEKLRWFSQWLLDVGDGTSCDQENGVYNIEIPQHLLVPDTGDPMQSVVSSTYDDLLVNLHSNEYFNDRAILAPTISVVNEINDYILSILPGQEHEYSSCDSVCKATEDADGVDNLYTTEFLNSITSSGLPQHKLKLKVGAPIMLLRNIDQSLGLCNGTRLRVTKLGTSVLEAVTLNGSHPNTKVLIHRMDTNPSETKWPFRMRRRQFPITLSFAMTINKSQGQSLRKVGIHLSKPVFIHGQLYVALSRVRSLDGLKIYVPCKHDDGNKFTTNVVYKEVFRNI